MTTNEVEYLKRFFESKFIHVSTYWLECCLAWVKEHYQTYTPEYMCEIVLQQWLETDLRDIEIRSLPPDLSKEKKTTINGNYALQLMYVKDVSSSSLSQLKKIRNMYKLTRSATDSENCDGTGKRALYLHLTDGVQFIYGFEYKTISVLNINMKPGTKLLLMGPLNIRNGEFILEEKNVKVLGGEVEDLLICNAVENVLARELNMPENPNPYAEIREEVQPQISENSDGLANLGQNNNNHPTTGGELQRNVVNPNQDLNFEDDIFDNIDFTDQLIEENQVDDNAASVIQNRQNENYNDSDFVVNSEMFEDFDDTEAHLGENSSEVAGSRKHRNASSDFNLDLDDELELMERIQNEVENERQDAKFSENVTDNLNSETKLPDNVPNNSTNNFIKMAQNPEPFIFIKYLLDNRAEIKNQTFRVKARFVRVIEKISLNKISGWTMKFEISDGSGNMVVDFLNSVIEDLLDLTVTEALTEKRNVRNNVLACPGKLSQALIKGKQKLESLNSLIDLQFKENCEIPTIVSIEEVTEKHLKQLKLRNENFPVHLC